MYGELMKGCPCIYTRGKGMICLVGHLKALHIGMYLISHLALDLVMKTPININNIHANWSKSNEKQVTPTT